MNLSTFFQDFKRPFKAFLFFLIVNLFTMPAYTQYASNYVFSTTFTGSLALDLNGNPVDLSGETNLIGNSLTGTIASNQPIGFDFWFMGVRYDTISIGPDGAIGMGKTYNISGSANNNLILFDYQPPTIAAFWDHLRTARGSGNFTVRKKVVGSSPNRCLVIEWHAVINENSTTTPHDGIFQTRLYETNNRIEFVYGMMKIGSGSGIVTASIGFTTGTADDKMVSVTDLSTYSTATTAGLVNNNLVNSSTVGNISGLHSESDGSRRTFLFTPQYVVPSAPTTITFPYKSGTGVQINFADNSTTETYFNIYRSTNSSTGFTKIGTLKSTTTAGTGTVYSYNAVGLNENTRYYFRISAQNEGNNESDYLAGNDSTSTGNISGTKTVGPSGDYASLTAAIQDIQMKGLSGNLLLELLPAYTSSSETFPIVFTNINTTATKQITVRPLDGATGLSITSDNYFRTIDIDNEYYIKFDGRPGGSGTQVDLLIENTHTNGNAIRITNESCNNSFEFCEIKGVTTNDLNGVIYFGSTPTTKGNNDNVINNCDIHSGSTTATNLIYCNGLNSTMQTNYRNRISNCNIYDFFVDGGTARGIYLDNAFHYWYIYNNSFYQTANRVSTSNSTVISAIDASDALSYGLMIHNNYIGGTAPKLGGDSTFNIYSTTNRAYFNGIIVNVQGGLNPSSVQGNRISRIKMDIRGNLANGILFRGINVSYGNVNVGDTTANIIGGYGGNDSLVFNVLATSFTYFKLIEINGFGNIKNNILGAATINPNTASTSNVFLYGISVISYGGTGININIENNLIGHPTTQNSFHIATHNWGGEIIGIHSTAYGGSNLRVQNNTLANLTSRAQHYTLSNKLIGIQIGTSSTPALSTITVTGNEIYKLSVYNSNNFDSANASVQGISIAHNPTVSCSVSTNNIHSLVSNNTITYPNFVTGIYAGDTSATTSVYEKNFIHNLVNASGLSDSRIYGIDIRGKNINIVNNMIQLGIDTTGAPITTATGIIGIHNKGKGINIYHNSVYIGGTGVGANVRNTYALYRNSAATDIIKNNIFNNSRSNATGGGGNHYAAFINNKTGLTQNNNIFFANGTDGILFRYNDANYTTLLSYQIASGLDIMSGVGSANFVNPNGNPATVNLHVASPTPIESSGINISGITTDFDNQIRSSLTPVDIGADAGNFTLLDIIPPAISYTPLGNGIAANRVLNNFASIIDNNKVDTNGNAPRLYFKKSTDNDVFGGNNSGVNGWKYVVASGNTSPYSFTIDYSIIFGGSVTGGDSIYYFVAAQDPNSNLSSMPAGVTGSSISNITAKPPVVYSYKITSGLSGTKNIPGDFPTLTGDGGFFQAMNDNTLTGNLTVLIGGNLSEDGTHALNKIGEVGVGGEYSVTIKPNSATLRNITGNVNAGLIRLNGASRVIIDGRYNDSTKYLAFQNTSTSGGTIKFYNDASYDTLRFCYIYGTDSDSLDGTIEITDPGTTGSAYICIENNFISDVPDTYMRNNDPLQNPKLIYLYCNVAVAIKVPVDGPPNHDITVRYNSFTHKQPQSIDHFIYANQKNYNLSIIQNHFYTGVLRQKTCRGIYLNTGTNSGGHIITQNYIGGSDKFCKGSKLLNDGNTYFTGIYVSSGSSSPSIIAGNKIKNIGRQSTTNPLAFVGIHTSGGTVTVGTPSLSNSVGDLQVDGSIVISDMGPATGIWAQNTTVTIENNDIGGITQTNESRGSISGIVVEGNRPVTLTCNLVQSLRTNNNNTSTSEINGIKYTQTQSGNANYLITNNLVSLGGGFTSNAGIHPLYTQFIGGNLVISNNTFYVAGTAGPGGSGSAGLRANWESGQEALIRFINNALVNNRSGGTSTNYGIYHGWMGPYSSSIEYNNNYYSTVDPSTFAWSGSQLQTFEQFKNTFGKDKWSQYSTTTATPPTSLWTDPDGGNFSCNTSNRACWSLNGWGQANSYVQTDHNGNPRSSNRTTGSTDIGHNEFDTDTPPPEILGSPAPSPGGYTYYDYNGRRMGYTKWSTDGEHCFTSTLTIIPGKNPPNATGTNPNAEYSNIYYEMNNIGGNGYTYDLSLYADQATLGKINNILNAKLARYIITQWIQYYDSFYDYYYQRVFAPGLSDNVGGHGTGKIGGPIKIAFGSSDNPLPVEIAGFSAKVIGRDVLLQWKTATETNVRGFELERSFIETSGNKTLPIEWSKIGFITAAGNSNSTKEYSYTDTKLNSGKFVYRLKMIDLDGSYKYSDEVYAFIDKPAYFELKQNYPNAFNPTTKIEYQLPEASKVRLELFNITGELVDVLIDEENDAGYYLFYFNSQRVKNGLASGVYIYRLIAESKITGVKNTAAKKMLLMK